MKKLLLSVAFLLAAFSNVNAQQLLSDDFDSYNVGNLATDLTGATGGQGDWKIYVGTGGNASNYQIASEPNKGNVLTISSPSNETTSAANNTGYVYKEFTTANNWATRTSGNNILRVEYEFYTGGTSTSKSIHNNYTFSANTQGQLITVGGYQYNPETRTLVGVTRSATALTGYNLGPNNTALVLPANTWVKVYYQINYTTNMINFQIPSQSVTEQTAIFLTNLPPVEVDFTTVGLTGNTSSSMLKVDNYMVSAVNNTALSVNDVISTKFNIYPNPASDIITISNKENIGVEKISIVDMNGRVVKTQSLTNQSEIQLNISDLRAGVYIFNISTKEGNASKKVIKK